MRPKSLSTTPKDEINSANAAHDHRDEEEEEDKDNGDRRDALEYRVMSL